MLASIAAFVRERAEPPWPLAFQSSQSLLVQVGTGYHDQGHDRASSRGRCLLAPGMSFLTHRAAPRIKPSDPGWNSKHITR